MELILLYFGEDDELGLAITGSALLARVYDGATNLWLLSNLTGWGLGRDLGVLR